MVCKDLKHKVVAYLKLLSGHSCGETEEIHDKSQSGQQVTVIISSTFMITKLSKLVTRNVNTYPEKADVTDCHHFVYFPDHY
jgi:hypothetical protein